MAIRTPRKGTDLQFFVKKKSEINLGSKNTGHKKNR